MGTWEYIVLGVVGAQVLGLVALAGWSALMYLQQWRCARSQTLRAGQERRSSPFVEVVEAREFPLRPVTTTSRRSRGDRPAKHSALLAGHF
jgi:hypothetical protein